MWGLIRRLLSLQTLFALLGTYVVLSASAIAFLDLGGAATLLAFVTLAFSVVAIGVLGAYVRWIRKEVASMNSPPPDWERDRVVEDDNPP
ncbi:hypothetical protein G9C85_12600 [Halorubellus sp. JP-L1]|uniref:hypothetical protein n=1 Tax=Halorubellus sp. JP-L1 TaxID=2715753 RepID=UPI00140A465D|nr:hypothetical protein [Halorubellus sp. JP-L1]NHN42458.1 hypothetical protein [Halorubellus sp. JP-L1]